MTSEQQRIAIAEFMGWKLVPRLFHNGEWKEIPTWVDGRFYDGQPEDYCMAGQVMGAMPPNYPTDLNLLHEVWCSFTQEQHRKFRLLLQEIVTRDGHVCGPCRSLSNATASQRSEAICGTIQP